MADRTIDIDFNLSTSGNASKGVQQLGRDLKAIEAQANQTREKMEKMAQVGQKMAMVGAAITAPFIMAMNKYVQTAGETEGTSKRIIELNKKWEESQVRIGRVVAESVLPALEKALDVVDQFAAFAERNPGFIQAALGIGGTLVTLGGLVATTAQIVSTIATVQGLAASAGIALGGTTAAGAGGVGVAAGGAGAAAVTAGITAALPAIVGAFSLMLGGNIGLWIGNALGGTNQTWEDIAETGRRIVFLVGYAWREMITGAVNQIGAWLRDGFMFIVNGFQKIFGGGQASGGYAMQDKLYRRGEAGREFVLTNATTRAAERLIGGRLTQAAIMQSMTNNINIGGSTIRQSRRDIRRNRAELVGALLG